MIATSGRTFSVSFSSEVFMPTTTSAICARAKSTAGSGPIPARAAACHETILRRGFALRDWRGCLPDVAVLNRLGHGGEVVEFDVDDGVSRRVVGHIDSCDGKLHHSQTATSTNYKQS